MRRATKIVDSIVVSENLKYIAGTPANNRRLAEILLSEQKGFCAYTDEYVSRTDAKDIEHFNPNLKNTEADNYNNWFVVKHQWNKEKSYKWDDYQPVLHPADDNFEKRVLYIDGDYFSASDDDTEAKNLISLLKLDDAALAMKRKKYIARKREEMKIFNQSATAFFLALIEDDICQVSYLRAIKEEFGVDLWLLVN